MATYEKTGVRATLSREWRRMSSRPVYLLFTLILPLAVFFFLWALFYAGSPRSLPVIVCDQDQSALSRRFVRLLASAPAIRISQRVQDVEEGRKILVSRSGYALIVIPGHLEQDVLRRKAPEIVCYYNMQLLTPGSMISQDFYKTVDALANRLVSEQNRTGMTVKQGEAVRLDTHVLFNPFLNYRYFLACALMPTMLQIFILMMTAFCAGIEFREGTSGQWLEAAGGSAAKAVLGKILPYTLIFTLTGLAMLCVTFALLEVPLRGSAAFLACATLLMIVAYQALGLLFVAVTGNLRLSLSFAAFYSVPAFAFTGVNFPVEAMSAFGKVWSAVLPLTYYGKILIDQSVRGASAWTSWPSMLLLVLFILAIPLPVVLRLKKILPDTRYRGRL